jgi:predicted dinucleotide-binding enzyme
VLFFAGDGAHAKSPVRGLIDRLAFVGIDLGSLVGVGRLIQIPGGSLPVLNLVKLG